MSNETQCVEGGCRRRTRRGRVRPKKSGVEVEGCVRRKRRRDVEESTIRMNVDKVDSRWQQSSGRSEVTISSFGSCGSTTFSLGGT